MVQYAKKALKASFVNEIYKYVSVDFFKKNTCLKSQMISFQIKNNLKNVGKFLLESLLMKLLLIPHIVSTIK